ncbi:hypothetical protein PR048_025005 [Dryococelus australis]|uniref:Uncharacterized protein n=1 Tax=Dryococelus australis TaxID=614101 RepID=A0ABQ9GQ94_9NEOP|nr:hypothetical protein PR048_025005 [Dryococelus australis]
MPFVTTESLTADRQRVLKYAKEKFGPRSCWTQDGRNVVLHTNRRFYLSSMRELVNIRAEADQDDVLSENSTREDMNDQKFVVTPSPEE